MIKLRNYAQIVFSDTNMRLFHNSCCVFSRKKKSEIPSDFSGEDLQQLLDNAAVHKSLRGGDNKWLRSPYDSEDRRDQAAKAFRPKTDPRQTSIILFPGQGVQHVGMGKSLLNIPEVKEMFEVASNILRYNLLDMCLNGPKNKLDQTEYCQPAIYVTSLAALQLMIEERRVSVESCIATAGFSIGEFASLVLANSLSFEAGLKLVKFRAEAMQRAASRVNGGMMTVFLNPASKMGDILKNAVEWCRNTGVENPVCSTANYLYPNCRVIAGNDEALRFVENNKEKLKIRACRRIPVSGAFHTDLMKPAAEEFAEQLQSVKINDPEISVHSNIDGLPYIDAKDIKRKLPKQIYRPVKWEQIMHILYDREAGTAFPQTFEVGPGKSLTSILRFANATAAKESVNIVV